MILDNIDQVEINKKEVYRYLGYKGAEPTPEIAKRIDECIDDVLKASEFRSLYQSFPLVFSSEGSFDIGDMHVESRDLWKNLKDCAYVYIFGATIGIGTDRLIARSSITDMMAATIYQAVGAAYIEAYCDEINKEINYIVRAEGHSTKPRFSPGYGDFTMDYQRKIFELLNLSKHTGISLTDGMLMTPSKSVTAIIGVKCDSVYANLPNAGDRENNFEIKHDCCRCNMTECAFRVE